MQIFPIDDTWSMQIWMAMVFLTYDRMILYIQNSIRKDELIHTYLDDSCLIQVAGDKCYGADHTVLLLIFILGDWSFLMM